MSSVRASPAVFVEKRKMEGTLGWRNGRFLVISLLICFSYFAHAGKGEPPRMDENAQTRFRVPIGTKQFKLVCPVHPTEKDNTMVDWSRDGEPIDWEHEYKTVKDNRELRMRNVKETDSGRFKCTAVNGFGYQSVEFIIQVYDPETDVLTIRDRISIANQSTPPEWLDDLAMQSATATPIRVNLGGKLELRCPARGNPLPEIRWLKNEQVVTQNGPIDSALFTVESAKASDSGEYRCEVSNKFGAKKAVYKVLVADFFDANAEELNGLAQDGLAPVIEQANITVSSGHTAQFLCKARASHKPIIKWLKQIADPAQAAKNATYVHANGMHLVLVEQTAQQLDGGLAEEGDHAFFTNRLVVPQVMQQHAGKYICVVTTPAGHIVYRSAFLSVEPGLMIGTLNLFDNVFWVISIPVVVVGVCLVTFAVCYLKSSSLSCDANGNVSKQHPPPPRIPPPPAPADVVFPQNTQLQQHHFTAKEKPHSPLLLKDSMFQPPRHATLDRMHTPHRLHRGTREDDPLHTYPSPNHMYWTQPKSNGHNLHSSLVGSQQSHHHLGPPPPTVVSVSSTNVTGNYRTLELPYGREPHPSVYSYEYAEHVPFLSTAQRVHDF